MPLYFRTALRYLGVVIWQVTQQSEFTTKMDFKNYIQVEVPKRGKTVRKCIFLFVGVTRSK